MTNLSDIHSGGANHNIASHSDTSGTGAELDELTDGSETTLHNHVGGISWFVINTDTTASGGNGYLINASGGNINLTLPTSPSEGDPVGVCDAYNKATTNVITVVRSGENIEGLAEDMVINVDGAGFTLVYADATRGWEIVSEIGSGSQTLIGLLDTPAGYDTGKYLQSTASGTEWGTISGNHSEFSELDYASAGHTGFQPAGDYATDAELTTTSGTLQTDIDTKISALSEDTSPQLGGDLDTGAYTVSGTGPIYTGDHVTTSGAQVVNVVYGTGSPPTASGVPIGTLFIKYTA